LLEALRFAAAAALSTTRYGAAASAPRRHEVEALMGRTAIAGAVSPPPRGA
jgi:sugar/nucleoside kinase (ribokinase family)